MGLRSTMRDDDEDPVIEVSETTPVPPPQDSPVRLRTLDPSSYSWPSMALEATIASPGSEERVTMPDMPAFILPQAPRRFTSVFRVRQRLAHQSKRR